MDGCNDTHQWHLTSVSIDLLYEVDTLVGVAVVIVGRRRVRVGRWPTGRVPNRWVGCWPVVVHRRVGVVVGTQPQ